MNEYAERKELLRQQYPVKKITDVEFGDCFVGPKNSGFSIRKIVGRGMRPGSVQYMSYGVHDGESYGIGVCLLGHLVRTWASRMATPEEIVRLHLGAHDLERHHAPRILGDLYNSDRALKQANEALKQEVKTLRAALRAAKASPKKKRTR